jgi:hypothetical protein
MTTIEHPFAKIYRAVLKEMYPDKESAIPEDSSLAANGVPEDVAAEALKRYFAGKELIVGPRFRVRPTNAVIKQDAGRTITYV